MTNKRNKLASDFGMQLCKDLKILEAIEYLRLEAIEALQGDYGDYEDGLGMEEYSSLQIFAHEKFDWWFNKNLDNNQKQKILEHAEHSNRFEITISSHRRSNLILDFLLKLKRTNADEFSYLHVFIDYKDIDSNDYEIYAEMLGQLSDDEISKMKMIYELKR
jgi:hypothetical protein